MRWFVIRSDIEFKRSSGRSSFFWRESSAAQRLRSSRQAVSEPPSLLTSCLSVKHHFPGEAGLVAFGDFHPVVRHVRHKGRQHALQRTPSRWRLDDGRARTGGRSRPCQPSCLGGSPEPFLSVSTIVGTNTPRVSAAFIWLYNERSGG